ncbi:hypothetical protein BDR03DRAFT_955244 [Suillus americanus]|nr:hypothetical protein BDR03DRAFT_955244 [Suillus americanus]
MSRRSRRSAANNPAHTGADAGQTIGLAGDHRTRGFPSHADGLGPVSSYALSQPNSTMTSSGGCDMLGHGGQQANFSVVSAWSQPLRVAEAPQVSKKDVVTKMKPAPKLGKKAQQANFSVVSAWPKPLPIAEAPQVSKKDVVTKMPFRQSTQQHLLRTDPPVAQAKSAPKLGKMAQQANFSVVSAWSKPLRIAEALQVSKNDVVTKMPLRQSTQQHLLRTDPPIAQAKPAPKLGKKAEMKVEKKAEKKKRKPFYKEVKKEIRGPAYWKKKAEEDACLLNSARGIWRHEVRKKAAEYRRRIVAKKCKRHRRVSPKWMEEKEGKNRGARHKKQDQRQFFVNFNKAYEDKLRVGKCCIFERTLGHFTIAFS